MTDFRLLTEHHTEVAFYCVDTVTRAVEECGLAIRCPDHPKYTGQRPPQVKCVTCDHIRSLHLERKLRYD